VENSEREDENHREVPLRGGHSTPGVVRIGPYVHRPTAPNAPFVHDILGYLEHAGFDGAPRFVGLDASGREVLSFIAGDVGMDAPPGVWSDAVLSDAATLLRRLHDAMADSPLAGAEETVCHNDFAPWNTVFRAGRPVAVIDFDDARPGPRVRDLAYAAWGWLALGQASFSVAAQARRVGLLCEAYGATPGLDLLNALDLRQHEILARRRAAGRTDAVIRVTDEIDWLRVHRSEFCGRLGIAGA
jgi:hypothetical protein